MTLAQRIERDLIRMLAKREPLPFKLSLSGIAKEFSVSPMPVRTAVQSLVDQGVLIKGEAGRLSVDEKNLPKASELPEDDEDAQEASIHDQLVDAFFHQHKHLQQVCEFVIDFGIQHVLSKSIIRDTVLPCAQWILKMYIADEKIPNPMELEWYLRVRQSLEQKTYLI